MKRRFLRCVASELTFATNNAFGRKLFRQNACASSLHGGVLVDQRKKRDNGRVFDDAYRVKTGFGISRTGHFVLSVAVPV